MKKYVGEVETIKHKIEYVFNDDGELQMMIGTDRKTKTETKLHKFEANRQGRRVKKVETEDETTEYYVIEGKMEKKLENVKEL